MTTYYVDPVNGNNGNNGQGPDAGHATNKPWQTIAKAFSASPNGISSGDTVWLAPGTYRERVTVAMTSATGATYIKGDPLNSQGFKTSGGVKVAPAPVLWTAFETSDTAAPSVAGAALMMSARDFLNFSNIVFIAGKTAGGYCVDMGSNTTSTDCSFTDCTFLGAGAANDQLIFISAAANTALNLTLSRCVFVQFRASSTLGFSITRPATADYNLNVLIENCIFQAFTGSTVVTCTTTGANTFNPGGVTIRNCTILAGSICISTGANWSTTYPTTVNNCIIAGGGTALSANTSGQIVEDYNLICSATPRSSVSTGTNSISNNSRSLMLEFGQAFLNGFIPRPYGTPYLVGASGLAGWGGSSVPSLDFLARPRPEGGQSTSAWVGALEVHDTMSQETSVVDASGSGGKIVGPGSQSLWIPVDAATQTISLKGYYDTNHAATNKPQIQLMANSAIGVSGQTVTMTVGVNTWETISLSSITPTAKGAVEIRLISRASAGNGVAYFDTGSVS